LIALDEEEQSRWESETGSAGWSKIEDKSKDDPAELNSQESWKKLAGRTILAGNQSLARKSLAGFVTQM